VKNIVYSFCFFVVGGLIYLYRKELSSLKPYITIPVMCIAVAFYYNYKGALPVTRTVSYLLVAASLLIFAITDAGSKVLHNNRFTEYISGVSMEIYLCHMVVFRGVEKLGLNTMFGNGAGQYIITLLIVIAGSVIFAKLFAKVMKKIER
jgi:peptidoglycan/LPS O-acetylase OafA/YrhL